MSLGAGVLAQIGDLHPKKYTGEYLDPTGLYHLRARQYDPSSGRFTTQDPLPNPVTSPYMSAYAYANDRPTILTDPSGLRAGTCGSIGCWFKQSKTAACLTGVTEGLALSAVSVGTLAPAAVGAAAQGCAVGVAVSALGDVLESQVGEKRADEIETSFDIANTGREVIDAFAERADRRAANARRARAFVRVVVIVIK